MDDTLLPIGIRNTGCGTRDVLVISTDNSQRTTDAGINKIDRYINKIDRYINKIDRYINKIDIKI